MVTRVKTIVVQLQIKKVIANWYFDYQSVFSTIVSMIPYDSKKAAIAGAKSSILSEMAVKVRENPEEFWNRNIHFDWIIKEVKGE